MENSFGRKKRPPLDGRSKAFLVPYTNLILCVFDKTPDELYTQNIFIITTGSHAAYNKIYCTLYIIQMSKKKKINKNHIYIYILHSRHPFCLNAR